jgi:demethylmenaquinone methyltransferase/2-methoxy-6-polyprenyl-1,4-benzoquinol methylase/phosphoethanolamine N-methyltransferase
MSHSHQNADPTAPPPETQGNVLHKALSYDIMTGLILRPSQASILALAQLKTGDKVLDVGCGSGRLSIAAQQKVGPSGAAYGIDPSTEMIAVARKNAVRAGQPAHFEIGVIEAIPFPDATFDVVLSRLMMHHLPGDLKQRGLAEVRRVLKPGGVCLIVDFEPPKTHILYHMSQHLLNHAMAQVNVHEYLPLLAGAGFVEVESGPTSSKLLSYARGRSPQTGL